LNNAEKEKINDDEDSLGCGACEIENHMTHRHIHRGLHTNIT